MLALLCMVVYAGTEVGVIQLIKPLTDGSFVERDPFVIAVMPFAIIGLFMVRASAGFGSSYGMAWLGQGIVARMRGQVFAHLLYVPVSHHDRARNADLQARLTYHATQIADSVTTSLTSLVKDGLTVIGLLGTMFFMSWRLAVFALVIAPAVMFLLRWVNLRFRRVSARIQQAIGEINHVADEAITGRRIVKIYGGEQTTLNDFEQLANRTRQYQIKLTATTAASAGSLEMIAAVAVSMLVYLATRPETLSTMTPGTFVAFIGAMLALRGPLSGLTKLTQRIQVGIVAASDLFTFLDTPVEQDSGRLAPERVQGALDFDHVRFSYDGDRIALDDVSLNVQAGTTVAFVGKSGSGKSTLLSMIPRFYDPDSGLIRLDGQDLREYRLSDLRRQIALVDQNVVLFNSTIGENIAYGRPGASREEVAEAARRAFVWDFIERLPLGLDTPIGQDGLLLSGGQRQRIAIARALLKDAPILILDEATSALDTESERYVQQALDVLKQGRTTLVIAHRLSTIQNADRIVVMHDGRIVEQGMHDELLMGGGAYAALHRLQFSADR